MNNNVQRFLACCWRCPACRQLTAGATKCVQCASAKPTLDSLALRALDCINAVLMHEVNHPHNMTALRLAYLLAQAFELGNVGLVLVLCERIEALELAPATVQA